MIEYEITEETCALIAINNECTKIIELDDEIIIKNSTSKILDYSCKYYGSSYLGRKEGSMNILKNIYKIPIIVEESRNIIFFPISSKRQNDTTWISLKNIKSYIVISVGSPIKSNLFKYNEVISFKSSSYIGSFLFLLSSKYTYSFNSLLFNSTSSIFISPFVKTISIIT